MPDFRNAFDLETLPPGTKLARMAWGSEQWVETPVDMSRVSLMMLTPLKTADGDKPWLSINEDMAAQDWVTV